MTLCNVQVNAQHYRNPIHCLKLTVKEEGVRGLTRGLGATLAREVPGNALFFVVYEVCHFMDDMPFHFSDVATRSVQ